MKCYRKNEYHVEIDSMSFILTKGKTVRGNLQPGEIAQTYQIDNKPGHFFSIKLRSKSISPRITVEMGSEIIEQSTCYSNQCKTGTIDGERYRGDALTARILPMSGAGDYKIKMIDHGDLDIITSDVIRYTNRMRRRNGLDTLKKSQLLTKAAQAHVDDMDAVGRYLGHESSDGRELRDRINQVGYEWSYIAENAASGQGSAKDVVKSWMNSTGHRANLLNKEISEIGVGYAIDDQSGATYWIQKFAAPD